MNHKEFFKIARKAFQKWQTNNATLRSAALAFFTIMPLPSILIMLASLSALIYGPPQGIEQLISQISVVAGPVVAEMADQILLGAENPFTSSFGSFVSILFALIGAIGAFAVLQDSLNIIWDVPPQKKLNFIARIRKRIIPFLLVSGTGAIVVAWSSLTTLLSSTLSFYLEPLIGNLAAVILGATQILLSFGLSALLFAFIYTQVPDALVAWRDVWVASLITSFVSTALNYLFGIYLRAFPVTTISGAAGALIVLLLWIFLMDQFILFGAQFSNVYAETLGSKAKVQKVKIPKSRPNKSFLESVKIIWKMILRKIVKKVFGPQK